MKKSFQSNTVKFMLSLLLILIFSMQSAHMAQAAVSPQPVANWNFDDCTARDSSGNKAARKYNLIEIDLRKAAPCG